MVIAIVASPPALDNHRSFASQSRNVVNQIAFKLVFFVALAVYLTFKFENPLQSFPASANNFDVGIAMAVATL